MQPHHRLYPDQPAVYCLASRDIDPSSVRTGSLGPPRDRHTSSISSRRRLPTERHRTESPSLSLPLSPSLSHSFSLQLLPSFFFFVFFITLHSQTSQTVRESTTSILPSLPLIGNTVRPRRGPLDPARSIRDFELRVFQRLRRDDTICNVRREQRARWFVGE